MTEFDFKKYHMRSVNAQSDQERALINQELKDLYASLAEDEKVAFNLQLESFLAREMGRLKSDYESINGMNNPN